MDWNLIESAPKDGTEILLYWPQVVLPDEAYRGGQRIVAIGRWGTPNYAGEAFVEHWMIGGRWTPGDDPTHWMPLPSPPQTQRPDEEAPLGADERDQQVVTSA